MKDGEYSIVVPSGPGVLAFRANDFLAYNTATPIVLGSRKQPQKEFASSNRGAVGVSEFNVLKLIDPKSDDEQLSVDLVVNQDWQIKVQLVDGTNTPVDRFTARANLSFDLSTGFGGDSDGRVRRGDTYLIRNLKQGESRRILFQTPDGKWAAVQEFELHANGERERRKP